MRGHSGSNDGRRRCPPQPCCPQSAAVSPTAPKSTTKELIALGFETLAVSTYSHKSPSLARERWMFCSKGFRLRKQILLSEGQQVTVHNPLPHLCSRSAMSLFMRAVVTCCSISNTSSHPVRIWVARAKILTFSS